MCPAISFKRQRVRRHVPLYVRISTSSLPLAFAARSPRMFSPGRAERAAAVLGDRMGARLQWLGKRHEGAEGLELQQGNFSLRQTCCAPPDKKTFELSIGRREHLLLYVGLCVCVCVTGPVSTFRSFGQLVAISKLALVLAWPICLCGDLRQSYIVLQSAPDEELQFFS